MLDRILNSKPLASLIQPRDQDAATTKLEENITLLQVANREFPSVLFFKK